MITEDYVSYKVAKLLKEKGFNPIYCGMYYSSTTGKRTTELLTSLIACPTLQMVMKWLREVHLIHIDIIIEGNGSCIKYYSNIRPFKIIYPTKLGDSIDTIKIGTYNTYEEAVKTAIEHCLTNLI